MPRKLVIRVEIDRRAAVLLLAAAAIGAFAIRLSSETLTLTTTYPAPVGVYNQVITTGDSGTIPANTVLARGAGNVILVPASNADGRVGVGVSAPLAKLDVGGTVRPGGFASDPAGSPEGAMYFNTVTKQMRLFNGAWSDLGGFTTGAFCGYMSTTAPPPPLHALNIRCQGADLAHAPCPAGFDAVNLGVGVTCIKR